MITKRCLPLFLILTLVPSVYALGADKKISRVTKNQAATGPRHALVIGNGKYNHARTLKNPVNDARAMTKVLKTMGFKVIHGEDQGLRSLGRTIAKFGRSVKEDGISLVYYSGHGVQINGLNYLVPIDAQLNHADEVDVELIEVNRILKRLKSRLNVVVLDACRNNPFNNRNKSLGSGGLAPMVAPTGTIISYATAAGRTAADGSGKHSPYTETLLKYINRPDLKIEDVFKKVRTEVYERTKKRQVAWVASSVIGEFYMASSSHVSQTPEPAPGPDEQKPPTTLAQPKPKVKTGEVLVSSNVNGASFVLGGTRYRTIEGSGTISGVKPGNYRIRAKKEGFKEWSASIRVKAGQVAKLEIRMEKEIETQPTLTQSGLLSSPKIEGLNFVRVKSGLYSFGAPNSAHKMGKYDLSVRKYRIVHPFFISITEVTQGTYFNYFNRTNYLHPKGDDIPVHSITWQEANEFCRQLTKTHKSYVFKLPNEAEWEIACRAGQHPDQGPFNSENQGQLDNPTKARRIIQRYAHMDGNSSFMNTRPEIVGMKRPNAWGLYDMHGNVAEWCRPILGEPGYAVDLSNKPIRGGTFNSSYERCRAFSRAMERDNKKISSIGFRVIAIPR